MPFRMVGRDIPVNSWIAFKPPPAPAQGFAGDIPPRLRLVQCPQHPKSQLIRLGHTFSLRVNDTKSKCYFVVDPK